MGTAPERPFVSRADAPPRKVLIASTMVRFRGSIDERLATIGVTLKTAAAKAAETYPGRGLDLVVLPEFTLLRAGATAAEQAVSLDGAILATLAREARQHRVWLIVPMILRESGEAERFSNAAVLFDRTGRVAGIYRKVFPMADDAGVFEGGVTPGNVYPVFECDFGRLGILICWDMTYEEAWDALAAGGAEIVALPSASPQTLRPMAQALRHGYYVVNSTQRDNVTLFDPIGMTIAQETREPGVIVEEIDLSFAILHWTSNLRNGRALADRFQDRVGYRYSEREDTGVFWSNDPTRSIGEMIRELGFKEMPEAVEHVRAARTRIR